ncbi:MAG: acyl-CoA thioesterase, partial [Oscillospiraceae bacterium]|nr:acyl-CoA thioesterase [Oscillospiraceae bacterium]
DANLIGNLLGGRLLHFIDIAGALAASRHSGGLVATKIMDAISFEKPVKVGQILELTAALTWTGHTSMEVAVDIYAEDTLTKERVFIQRAHLLFVAIDRDGKKRPVPPLLRDTEAARQEFAAAEERQARRRGE